MNTLYELYETNKTNEIDGKWIDLGPARVKLARTGGRNTKYSKIYNTLSKKYGISNEKVTTENEEKINTFMIELLAKAVVKDWNVKDENDEWIQGIHIRNKKTGKVSIEPFTYQNVIKCLTELPDLFFKLNTISMDMKTFLKSEEEDDLKN